MANKLLDIITKEELERMLFAEGISYQKLAVKYNVGASSIRAVVRRQTWKHVL